MDVLGVLGGGGLGLVWGWLSAARLARRARWRWALVVVGGAGAIGVETFVLADSSAVLAFAGAICVGALAQFAWRWRLSNRGGSRRLHA
jgi:hypothetical protein